jgi:DNA-binding MarR family transcriptional regulator
LPDLISKAVQELSPETSQFKVLTYLSFKGPSLPNEISEDTRITPGTVRPALRNLLEKGYVTQSDDGTYSSAIPFTEFISNLYAQNRK